MNWTKIKTQTDADALTGRFGGFHDACVREAHVWTDHWVARDLSMSCPGHLDTRVRLLIHRQVANPAAIELLFEEVTRFNLVPTPDNFDTIIFGATLLFQEEIFYWSPKEVWSPNSPNRDDYTWISALQLRWREVDWLGEQLHYGPRKEE